MKKVMLSAIIVVAFGLSVAYTHLPAKTAIATKPATVVLSTLPSISPSAAPLMMPKTMPTNLPPTMMKGGSYRDGTFVGQAADAIYGPLRVKTTILNGRITDIQFVDYPHDRQYSQMINTYAMPRLKQEALTIQRAGVDIISGATDSSLAFRESLASALKQAS